MKKLHIGLAAPAIFSLPGMAFADTIVFTAPAAVPEPATMTLLGTALAGLYYRRCKQQQR